MKTKCPHCKANFKVADEHLNKNAKCPKCKQAFVIVPLTEENDNANAERKAKSNLPNPPVSGHNENDTGICKTDEGKTTTEVKEDASPSKSAFGGLVGTIGFILMIVIVIPFIKSQLGHNTPISPEHLEKLKKMSRESSRRNEVPVGRRQENLSQSLPADGIYSNPQGSGGSYKDPIHGFFEVEPPKRFKAKERRDKTTTRLDNGTYVPCSRVNFKSGDTQIGVVTRKSPRGTIDTDIEVVLRNYKRVGAIVKKKRPIQIDGVKGYEVLSRIKDLQLLLVKYKKHGLDHAITISCSPADFSKLQNEFTDFLRSYRSINP